MSSYNTFAYYYDRLTENAEYKVRSEFISNFFCEYNKDKKKVLDLACGTGNISKYLSEKGYEVTGIDLSEDMLNIAINKDIKNAVFLKGDMTSFKLPYKVDNCVCSLDSINHLTTEKALCNCFNCVFNALDKGGIFVFDVNTVYKHNKVLDNNSFVFDEEDFFLSWDNTNLDNNEIQINLDFFVFNGKNYDRYSEEFTEKAYDNETIINLLSKNGFEVIKICADIDEKKISETTQRLYFVCKRK